MSTLFREAPFDMPWRRVYEARAAVAWTLLTPFMLVIALMADLPSGPFFAMSCISVVWAAWRWRDAFRLWNLKLALVGRGPMVLTQKDLIERLGDKRQTHYFFGRGFLWDKEHSQRFYDLSKVNRDLFMPPDWLLSLRGIVVHQHGPDDIGDPSIHGVSQTEEDIFIAHRALAGHTVIAGVTGAGKTVAYGSLVTQAIVAGGPVIVMDPKGDRDLRARIIACCKQCGREEDFIEFDPAKPARSVRLDPLKSFSRVTEISNRLTALLPQDGRAQAFTQKAWQVCNIIVTSLIDVDERPSLMKLAASIESRPDDLLLKVLLHHFRRTKADWQTLSQPYIDQARKKDPPKGFEDSAAELIGYVHFYELALQREHPNMVLDRFIAHFREDRAWLGKMIGALVSVLQKLTTDELGPMLSPDPFDIEDERPIYDARKVIMGSRVLYMDLDAMPDREVASAIGTIFVSDLTAVAGQIYNAEGDTPRKKISLFVDEASEVLCAPFIQLANKGRGAGLMIFAAMQTFADVEQRLGSKPAAEMVLGNFNNVFALRTMDPQTQRWIVDQFGRTFVGNLNYSVGTSGNTAAGPLEFSGQEGVSTTEQLLEIVPPELLAKLPNGHYFALFSGGRLIKGRVPIINDRQNN